MNINNNKIKDINDLYKLNLFNKEVYESCFSNDQFDVLLI